MKVPRMEGGSEETNFIGKEDCRREVADISLGSCYLLIKYIKYRYKQIFELLMRMKNKDCFVKDRNETRTFFVMTSIIWFLFSKSYCWIFFFFFL